MFEVKQDERGHYVTLNEGQLAQLSRTPVGEALFDCKVLRSDYVGGAVGTGQPFLAEGVGQHVLVFQYKARLFGCLSVVRPDELPWDAGFAQMAHQVYDLDRTRSPSSLLPHEYAIKA